MMLCRWFVVTVLLAGPLCANNPPGPMVSLPEVFLLPVMALLTWLGGGHRILRHLGRRPRFVVVGAILMVLFSGVHEGFGWIVVMIFGCLATVRAIRLLYWGAQVTRSPCAGHLADAKGWRLIPCGVLLLLLAVGSMGMASAFVGYWPRKDGELAWLEKYLVHQLATGQIQLETTGVRRFDTSRTDSHSEIRRVRIEFGPEGRNFTIRVPPRSPFPFAPYHWLTTQPSYFADQSGTIRMIRVHSNDAMCPADAPVVARVLSKDYEFELELMRLKAEAAAPK